jgi:LmbE family N-acetylglucosaminyl deacetylase
MSVPEGVPYFALEKLLDEERARQMAMPEEMRTTGVLRIPENLSAPMLAGDAQRNVPGIMALIQQEAEKKAAATQRAKARMGEGLSLPMSRGMMTFSGDKLMSFMATFQD